MTKKKTEKKPPGRPSTYSDEVGAAICERIALGESLRSICRDDAMPSLASVFLWLKNKPGFSEQYVRAREVQADTLADEIIEIADESANDTYVDDDGNVKTNTEVVARSKLRVDARKWIASKLKPKVYGDRQQIDMEVKDVTPMADRMKQARERARGK